MMSNPIPAQIGVTRHGNFVSATAPGLQKTLTAKEAVEQTSSELQKGWLSNDENMLFVGMEHSRQLTHMRLCVNENQPLEDQPQNAAQVPAAGAAMVQLFDEHPTEAGLTGIDPQALSSAIEEHARFERLETHYQAARAPVSANAVAKNRVIDTQVRSGAARIQSLIDTSPRIQTTLDPVSQLISGSAVRGVGTRRKNVRITSEAVSLALSAAADEAPAEKATPATASVVIPVLASPGDRTRPQPTAPKRSRKR